MSSDDNYWFCVEDGDFQFIATVVFIVLAIMTVCGLCFFAIFRHQTNAEENYESDFEDKETVSKKSSNSNCKCKHKNVRKSMFSFLFF